MCFQNVPIEIYHKPLIKLIVSAHFSITYNNVFYQCPISSFQLKQKKKDLKEKLKKTRDENSDLQLQIEQLNAELQKNDEMNALQQKQKKKDLKEKLKKTRDENSDLKVQIEQMNLRLQKQVLSSKHDNIIACSNMVSKPMNEILIALQSRTTTHVSADGVSISLLLCFYLT